MAYGIDSPRITKECLGLARALRPLFKMEHEKYLRMNAVGHVLIEDLINRANCVEREKDPEGFDKVYNSLEETLSRSDCPAYVGLYAIRTLLGGEDLDNPELERFPEKILRGYRQ